MSTLAYAAITSRREESVQGTSSTPVPAAGPTTAPVAGAPAASGAAGQPGVTPWIDALSALVPVEVLAVHALVLGLATTTTERAGSEVTTITDSDTLVWTFIALCVSSSLVYVFGHFKNFDRWDVIRMLIPPAAFAAWTMLLKSSAWDAVAPNMSTAARTAAGAIAALLLGSLAAALASPADQKPPPPPPPGGATTVQQPGDRKPVEPPPPVPGPSEADRIYAGQALR